MPSDIDTPDLANLANLAKDWDSLHTSVPTMLYHYTTAAGLMGILNSHRLWATNARFLNDPTEIRYALKVVSDTMRENEQPYKEALKAEPTLTVPDIAAALSGRKIPRIESWAKDLLEVFDHQREVYVTSFCEQGDLLSQWRGYAAGGGYAIGVSAREIWQPVNARPGPPVLLRKVIYDPENQRRIVSRWVRAMFDLDLAWRRARRDELNVSFQDGKKNPAQPPNRPPSAASVTRRTKSQKQAEAKPFLASLPHIAATLRVLKSARIFKALGDQGKSLKQIEEIQTGITRFLAECLISFKDPAYYEEREWRAIQFGLDSPLVKFRTQEGNIVPFVELDLTAAEGSAPGRLPIRKITYGPTLEPGLSERALKILCGTSGYSDTEVTVSQSSIPYRG
jgi:hypothetical protein